MTKTWILFIILHTNIYGQIQNICTFSELDLNKNNYNSLFDTVGILTSCISDSKTRGEEMESIEKTKAKNEPSLYQILSENDEYYFAILKLLKENSMAPNFIYSSCPKLGNACATIIQNSNFSIDRHIIVDKEFLNEIRTNSKSDYPALFVLLHEIGHHLNNHSFIRQKVSNYQKELEADEFAGFYICQMGASLDDALFSIQIYGSVNDSPTHPNMRSRIDAITKGYKNCEKTKTNELIGSISKSEILRRLYKMKSDSYEFIRLSEKYLPYFQNTPEEKVLRRHRATAFFSKGLFEESNQEIERLANINGWSLNNIENSQLSIMMADNYFRMNNFTSALMFYHQVINSPYSDNALVCEAKISIAKMGFKLGLVTPDDYIEKCNVCKYISSELLESSCNLAESEIEVDKFRIEANNYKIRAIKILIDNHKCRLVDMYSLASLLVSNREYYEAIDFIDRNYDNIDMDFMKKMLDELKVVIFYSLTRYSEAKVILDKIISIYPYHLSSHPEIEFSLINKIYFNN